MNKEINHVLKLNQEISSSLLKYYQDPSRPVFPKRVLITGGMPYGNKELHFGHIGGMFVHADAYARFMRDRIGTENVLFISGTDCYGSVIVEYHRQMVNQGKFSGTIQEFVEYNHQKQKEVLNAYGISLNIFAASGIGRSKEIHAEFCAQFFKNLYKNGHLIIRSTPQFYDPKAQMYLNGRQVVGKCPIPGCKSEVGYADECALGHPYEPSELIDPKSVITGETPEIRFVSNWYIDLEKFKDELLKWIRNCSKIPQWREFSIKAIEEFLEPPAIYIKTGHEDKLYKVENFLPKHEKVVDKTGAVKLVFSKLAEREKACEILNKEDIRYRNGKTLVPFRLSGNVPWGVPVPNLPESENDPSLKDLTFWVWPESLWAPISFTATILEKRGLPKEKWRDWWCNKETQVYQFIGEDNIYFYGPAEMSMFMGNQGPTFSSNPADGELQLPHLIVNNHILFFDKKASSSGSIKPPMAHDLLNYYTADQLRTHFLALGLSQKSVPFKPKPFNPNASPSDQDPVLKEANLLSNVFNRAIRTCFYTTQKYFNGIYPNIPISDEIIEHACKTILEYEKLMWKMDFHLVVNLMDSYIRNITKFWSSKIKPNTTYSSDDPILKQTLVDAFHMVKTATVLMHPIAPFGTEKVKEYLQVSDQIWNWNYIFEPLPFFFPDPNNHKFKFLEPRVDFFPKHPSQVSSLQSSNE